MTIEDLAERIYQVEKALEHYRQYKTAIEDLGTDVMYIQQRLNKLEELAKERAHLINYKSYLDLADRITKLESHFSGDYQLIASKLTPHKCPVCDGAGGIKHPLTGLVAPATCHGCEGKGIVWG